MSDYSFNKKFFYTVQLKKQNVYKTKCKQFFLFSIPFQRKGSTYFCHIRKATRLKGIMGVAIQEARTKQSCVAGGASRG